MDHVVYVDAAAKEIDRLIDGSKTMIIRGAAGRKLPYGRVNAKDVLYFIRNNGEGIIKAKASVVSVLNSEMLEKKASVELVESNQEKLQLNEKQFKRWAGKRYLVLIEIDNFKQIAPFSIDRSSFGNMDDWLPVEDIKKVTK